MGAFTPANGSYINTSSYTPPSTGFSSVILKLVTNVPSNVCPSVSDQMTLTIVAVPDISHISLAPPGAPLDELRPERRPVTPDTSALELAPPG